MIRLGAVADDVTGACDLAGHVADAGLPATILLAADGADDGQAVFPSGGDGCAVVALKIRTAPKEEAVERSSAAARLLLDAGATLLYQKYCSTFDSTPSGNIGPIADALAAAAGATTTLGTPATTLASRTQYSGTLFVGGVPLAESPMRFHPLTPMRDSNVLRLLQPQTPTPVSLVHWESVRSGPERIAALAGDGHVLVDALTRSDLDAIAGAVLRLAENRPLVATGAAGVGTALARVSSAGRPGTARRLPPVPMTGRLILAGSASAATRAQIASFPGETHLLDPLALAAGDAETQRLQSAVARRADPEAPLLIAASPDVERVQEALGADDAARLIEEALAGLAAFAVHELGMSHLLVAGGETSGAVTSRLGVSRLLVGEQAAPGVPWTVAQSGGRSIALLLKSGNFGGADLFTDAWEVAP